MQATKLDNLNAFPYVRAALIGYSAKNQNGGITRAGLILVTLKTNTLFYNGTMSDDIFKQKMGDAIKIKWTFLALRWAIFCLKIVSIFPRKQPL